MNNLEAGGSMSKNRNMNTRYMYSPDGPDTPIRFYPAKFFLCEKK